MMDEFAISDYNCSLLYNLSETEINQFEKCTEPTTNFQKAIHIILQSFYGIICVFGVSGNSLVIHVVTKYSKMQTVTNFYILNLAVADILFLSGLPFFLVTSEIKNWIFGNITCKVYMVITSLNQFTSSFLLTIMSADRYVAVCHPLNAQKYRTSSLSKFISLTAWALASLMIVPVFMYSTTVENGDRITCIMVWTISDSINGPIVFTYYSLIISFILPFVLIFIFYGLVICKLKKLGRKSNSAQKKKSQKKVTRLVLTLIIVYGLSYLPYWSLQANLPLMTSNTSHSPTMVTLYILSSCLTYSNSAVNPVLYAFLSDNFNKSFKKACFCTPKSGNYAFKKTRHKKRNKTQGSRRTASDVSTRGRGTVIDDTGTNLGTYCETSFASPNSGSKRGDDIEAKPQVITYLTYSKTTQL